jgi:glycerol uptake facilitator-like aquaporin
LVCAITSAAKVYSKSGRLNVIGIGLAHVSVLMAILFAIGHKSGAHVIPAVTIAFLITKSMNIRDGLFYIIYNNSHYENQSKVKLVKYFLTKKSS